MNSSSSPSSLSPTFKQLKVAIIGGGIGGLSAAVALRRAGHIVEIFERRSFDIEVSSFLAFPANGAQWLREWEVDIPAMKPTIVQGIVARDWETGAVLHNWDLSDYETTWGHAHYAFHRKDLHKGLLHTATSETGKGTPCKVAIDHMCEKVNYETGTVTFENGRTVTVDLIVGADGIRSVVRKQIGITPSLGAAKPTCYRCNIPTEEVRRLGLTDHSCEPFVQVWGGTLGKNGRDESYRVVMCPCSGGDLLSIYCFMPSELTNHHQEGFEFKEVPVEELLQGNYGELHSECANLIKHSVDRMPWRLFTHQPYEYWHKSKVCIMGDAAHPMLPYQAQGACQAIEDAAALGIVFSDKYNFTDNVEGGLAIYQKIRKERATRVQQSSTKAMEDVKERIGFTTLTPEDIALAAKEGRLTVHEMNLYRMHDHVAAVVGSERA